MHCWRELSIKYLVRTIQDSDNHLSPVWFFLVLSLVASFSSWNSRAGFFFGDSLHSIHLLIRSKNNIWTKAVNNFSKRWWNKKIRLKEDQNWAKSERNVKTDVPNCCARSCPTFSKIRWELKIHVNYIPSRARKSWYRRLVARTRRYIIRITSLSAGMPSQTICNSKINTIVKVEPLNLPNVRSS